MILKPRNKKSKKDVVVSKWYDHKSILDSGDSLFETHSFLREKDYGDHEDQNCSSIRWLLKLNPIEHPIYLMKHGLTVNLRQTEVMLCFLKEP